jgi:hypothetical protein
MSSLILPIWLFLVLLSCVAGSSIEAISLACTGPQSHDTLFHMFAKQELTKFLAAGKDSLYDLIWSAAWGLPMWFVAKFGIGVSGVVAIFLALLGGFVVQQFRRNAKQDVLNDRLGKTQQMLVGVALTAEDVLSAVEKTNQFGAAIEQGFRNAADRRAWEADQMKQYGRVDAIQQLARAATFEGLALRDLKAWDRQFAEVTIKLDALGYRVFVPSEPQAEISGTPSAEAVKMICQREALNVAADALRRAHDSTASG